MLPGTWTHCTGDKGASTIYRKERHPAETTGGTRREERH